MEKSATDVLLQLIDCIESLKNEVKRKMNTRQRAMLYQSHTRNNSQEKNHSIAIDFVPNTRSRTRNSLRASESIAPLCSFHLPF
jgi:hypothetical protein